MCWNTRCCDLIEYLECQPLFCFMHIRCQVAGGMFQTSGSDPLQRVLSLGVQRGLGDEVRAQDGPLMPGESGMRNPGSSPCLLPVADPTARTRADTSSGAAKVGMLRKGCTDSPAEPVTELGLQAANSGPNQQATLSQSPSLRSVELPLTPHSCSSVSLQGLTTVGGWHPQPRHTEWAP